MSEKTGNNVGERKEYQSEDYGYCGVAVDDIEMDQSSKIKILILRYIFNIFRVSKLMDGSYRSSL